MRQASSLEDRLSRAVTIVATVWFGLAAAWELTGPVLAGHYASSASMGIIAENMVRWHMWAPVWVYTPARPTPDFYYCHHPWGIFWTTKLFYWLFGHHDFVCRLPAVLLSIATPPLLSATCRTMFRPYAGAAAALGFVVLPITLSFACFNALEVPVMAHGALMLYGYVKLRENPKKRYVALSLLGATLALNADWPAYVLVGALLGADLVAFLFAKRELELRRVQWWVSLASLSVMILVLYVREFREDGKLDDLLGAYSMRSAGNEIPLSKALENRRYWIELSFTPIAILLGKLYALVAVARFAVRRTTVELIPLAVLLMAIVQYVVFRQGADIHVFWPHYFAEYFAFACAGLVATFASLAERAWARFRPALGRYSGEMALGLVALPLSFVLRDGVVALRYAHDTGGRFNEKGLRIESDGDKIAALVWAGSQRSTVALHPSLNANWASIWALGGRVVPMNSGPPAPGSDAVTVADARFVGDATKAAWIRSFGVTAIGPFWVLDTGAHPPVAFSFGESEPNPWQWYFRSGTEPVRSISEDPWATWELRTHYGIDAATPTTSTAIAGPAGELEMHRVRHNAAVLAGDAASAADELLAMDAKCHPVDGEFDDGTRIRCVLFHEGASPLLVIVFEPSGPLTPGVELRVASHVVAPMRLSTTMADPIVRETSFPFSLAPSLFRKGFIYSHEVRVRHRPGTEVFDASFAGPNAPSRSRAVEVLRWP